MVDRSVNARYSVTGTEEAARKLDRFGERGERAFRRMEGAIQPANRALVATSRAATAAQGGIRNLASSFAIFEGPLGTVSGRINAFGAALGRINPLTLAAAAATATLAGGALKASVAGGQYERFLLRTEQQLIATRFASGLTAKEIDRFTFALAQNTLASTEGARRAAAELLTFRAVSGETFKETLVLAQDLAASGIGSLESNVLQLGKALQDPVRGLTALSRAGVQFTEQQKEQIRVMAEAGDRAAAQNLILGELRDQVGGAGEAEAGGLAGAWDTLTENMGRFFEQVGEKSGLVDGLTEGLKGLAGAVRDLTPDASPAAQLAAVDAQIAGFDAQIRALSQGTNEALRAAQRPALEEILAGRDALIAQRVELQRLSDDEARARQEAAAAAKVAAEAAREEAEAEAARKAAAAAAKKLERERARERAQALAEIARLEEKAALAGLEGVAKLEVERDRALAEFEQRRAKEVISAEDHAKARLAIEENFQKEKADLEDEARRKREAEEKREREKQQRAEDRTREKAAREAEREAERQAEAAARPFINAAERIQEGFSDAFFEIFRNGELKAESFLDGLKDAFARTLAEIATLAIARPIIVPAVAAVAGGLGLGSDAVGQVTGNLGGGAGGLGGFGVSPVDFASFLPQLFGGGEFLSGIGASLGFAHTIPAGTAALGGAIGSGVGGLAGTAAVAGAAPGVGGLAGTAAVAAAAPGVGGLAGAPTVVPGILGTTTFAQFLGGAGLGFGAGSLLNSLIGGNALGGTIGSGVGGLAGAALGSVIPGVGTILGGLIGGAGGGLLGGLFGSGKSVGPNAIGRIGARDGLAIVRSAAADNGGSAAQARAFARQVTDTINSLAAGIGAEVLNAGINAVGSFQSQGGLYFRVGKNRTFFGQDSEAAGEAAVLASFARGRLGGIDEDLQAAVRQAARVSESLQDFAANIDFAKAFLAEELLEEEDLTAAEQAIRSLNEAFEEAAERAERLGFSVAKLEGQREKALAALTEGFDESVRLQVLAFTNPVQAALDQLEIAHEQRLKEAEALGADLVEVERLNGLERQRVIEQASAGALTSLKAFRDEITFGGLSGVSAGMSVVGARAAFEAAAAQASAGDATALGQISGLGTSLLTLSRTAFASSQGFQADLARVREVVEALLVDIPGFASGTAAARPGLALVGEGGRPELVAFRGGERVFSGEATRRILAGGGTADAVGREVARGTADIVAELRAMRRAMEALVRENKALRLQLDRPRAA